MIVISISTVYAFTHTTTLEVLSSRHRIDLRRAEMLARSGHSIALQLIQNQGADQLPVNPVTEEPISDPWELVGWQPIKVPDGQLRITIEDGGSRINLNALVDEAGQIRPESPEFLEEALERVIENMPGRAESKSYRAREVALAILDWVDSDTLTASFGDDELSYYMGTRGATAGPVNRPIFSIEELSQIPSIDAPLIEALQSYFTTFPLVPRHGEGGVNPNTAPAHVVGLLCHGLEGDECRLFSRSDVYRVLRLRKELRFCERAGFELCTPFMEEMDLIGESIFPPLHFSSGVFQIEIEARYRRGPEEAPTSETRTCLATAIDFSDRSEPRTLYYRKGC